ncbi:MAG TPA: radical SAM protein [Candidatus Hydrothermia bacterium]|nr:radical SAM protein [Candidatus Hydrothermia bacterium]HOL23257.1 radical SAM protein [Candidatus Hydrothermia bacterium]HOP32557.1 radical SAM protein [Candidatus Hydrothermia bacterium]HPO78267.1 radical SAM protein [Candidatus Hydrothermia bacterium]
MVTREIRVKGILSKSKVYDWVINPYVGCQYGCTYCYARFMKRFTGHSEPWGQFVDVKVNAPELLLKELRQKQKGEIWMSGVCDPYQPLEEKYQIIKSCLEILSQYDWPVVIQTKSPIVLRDLPIFKRFSHIDVGFSIGTGSESIRELFEPNAPPISSRIEALRMLHSNDVRTYVMVAPALPEVVSLVPLLRGIVDYVLVDKMNYHYADWVFKRYGLNRVEDVAFLSDLFKVYDIPCEVVC